MAAELIVRIVTETKDSEQALKNLRRSFAEVRRALTGTGVGLSAFAAGGILLGRGLVKAAQEAGVTSAAMVQMQDAVWQLKVTIGEQLIAVLEPLFNLIARLAEGFGKLDPRLQKVIVVVGAVAVGLAAIGGPLLLLVAALPGFVAGIGLLSVAFGALTVAMGPITLVILGIAAAVAAGVFIWRNWETIIEGVKAGLAGLDKMLGGIITDLGLVNKEAGEEGKTGWGKWADAILMAMELVIPGTGRAFDAIKKFFGLSGKDRDTEMGLWEKFWDTVKGKHPIMPAVGPVPIALPAPVGPGPVLGPPVPDALETSGLWDALTDVVKEKWAGLQVWWSETAWPAFKEFWSTAWLELKSQSAELWIGIKDIWRQVWTEGIAKWWKETAWPAFKKFWKEAWEELPDPVQNVIRSMVAFIDKHWEGLKESIRQKIADLTGWINNLIKSWNALEFRVPKITLPEWLGGGSWGGFSVGTPDLPLIAMPESSGMGGGKGVTPMAHGGRVVGAGRVIVGEGGRPEVLDLPKGATVTPLPRGASEALLPRRAEGPLVPKLAPPPRAEVAPPVPAMAPPASRSESTPPLLLTLPARSATAPPPGAGGNITVIFNYHQNGPVYGILELRREIVEAWRDAKLEGGFRGVI